MGGVSHIPNEWPVACTIETLPRSWVVRVRGLDWGYTLPRSRVVSMRVGVGVNARLRLGRRLTNNNNTALRLYCPLHALLLCAHRRGHGAAVRARPEFQRRRGPPRAPPGRTGSVKFREKKFEAFFSLRLGRNLTVINVPGALEAGTAAALWPRRCAQRSRA